MKAIGSKPFSLAATCKNTGCCAKTGWPTIVAAATRSIERRKFCVTSDFIRSPRGPSFQRGSDADRTVICAEVKVPRGTDFQLWAGILNSLVPKSGEETIEKACFIGFLRDLMKIAFKSG